MSVFGSRVQVYGYSVGLLYMRGLLYVNSQGQVCVMYLIPDHTLVHNILTDNIRSFKISILYTVLMVELF